MNLQSKIQIDKFVFVPLVALASLLSFLKRKIFGTRSSKTIHRIAVVKLTGMGSIIQLTPMLQTLKKNFPEAELVFITSRSNEELMQLIPIVNETWIIDDHGLFSFLTSFAKLFGKFLSHKIDLYFDLEVYSYFSTFLTFLSGGKRKFGLHRIEGRIRSGVYDHIIYYNSRIPVSEVYLQLVRVIPLADVVNTLYDFSAITKNRLMFSKNFPSSLSPDFIVINPNASELRVERRWGAKNFSLLINYLAAHLPAAQFVITGARNEIENAREVLMGVEELVRSRVADTSGQLSLMQLIELIAGAKLIVTNDSGPMHLAFALQTPVVALFGPCSPLQYQTSDNAFIVYKNLYCSPCVHLFLKSPCNGDNQCMKKISVDEVKDVCVKALSGEKPLNTWNRTNHMEFLTESIKPLGIIHR